MTDKNGVPVIPGCLVWATPDGETEARVILVTQVAQGSGQRMDVEVLPLSDERVREFFRRVAAEGFSGGGGSFGGGGASGQW